MTYICTTTLQNLLQIVFLLTTHNFIIYLLIQIACTLANNIIISVYVDRHYSYLKQYKDEQLCKEDKQQSTIMLKRCLSASFSSAVVTSTDNLLISKFVSTIVLGLYSNYTLFTTMLHTILSKIFEALTGSVRNLVALEPSDKVYKTLEKYGLLISGWYLFSCAALFALCESIYNSLGWRIVSAGREGCVHCLPESVYATHQKYILTFNDTYGMFKQLKPKCIAEAIINLTVSLLFVGPMKMGIYGVLLGTFVSNITTNFWYEPYLLFKKFGVSLKSYFPAVRRIHSIDSNKCGAMFWVCNYAIVLSGWIGFILKVVVTCICINLFYIVVFARTDEFKYFLGIVKAKIKR